MEKKCLWNGWSRTELLIFIYFIKGIGLLPGSATYQPLIAQADDNIYMKTGKRLTGMLFSCSSIGIKIGQGLGTAIVGWALAWSGYDGLLQEQPQSAVNMIQGIYLIVPIVTCAITFLLYLVFDVEKNNSEIRKMVKE